jgi:hypothetical protein
MSILVREKRHRNCGRVVGDELTRRRLLMRVRMQMKMHRMVGM